MTKRSQGGLRITRHMYTTLLYYRTQQKLNHCGAKQESSKEQNRVRAVSQNRLFSISVTLKNDVDNSQGKKNSRRALLAMELLKNAQPLLS